MTFNTIGIVGKRSLPKMTETLQTLINLLKKLDKKVILSDETTAQLKNNDLPTATIEELAKQVDLVMVVGGDGSLLSTGRVAALCDTPILGINLGCLGFLTDVRTCDIEEKITAILNGQFIEEDRFLLEINIPNQENKPNEEFALNEIVLSAGQSPHMLDFEIYINDTFMYSQRSDGLIVATPTGSTAYALSAGGPIIHPSINAVILIPIFPHSLTNRPIVIDADSDIRITLSADAEAKPTISCDSQNCINVSPDDTIHIHKMSKPLHLIHPTDYNYFDALYSKLNWGKQLICK